jgi:lipopolysaccharide heptosyltransferase II
MAKWSGPAERILVVVPNWYGEVLFVTPLLGLLRASHPRAELVTLGVTRACEVLQAHAPLNELINLDDALYPPLIGAVSLLTQLQTAHFDTAIIVRRSLSRTLLLALARIPRRIGFSNRKTEWLLTDPVDPPAAPMHKGLAYLRLLEPLGIRQSTGRYAYMTTAEEREFAHERLRRQGLTLERPIVVCHPGANWAHKRWLPERFAEVATRLRRHGVVVLLTGGPDDAALVEQVNRHMDVPAPTLVGQTTFREMAACLELAALVVSHDTGILHVAAALGRPIVGLYGPTSPELTGPLGDPALTRVIHHPDCCPAIPCMQPHHPGAPGMASIAADEVYAAACDLLHLSPHA